MSTCTEKLQSEAGVKLVVHNKPKGEDGSQQADELLAVVAAGSLTAGVSRLESYPLHSTPLSPLLTV